MAEAKTPVRSSKVFRAGAILNWLVTLPAIVSPVLGAGVIGIDNLAEPFLLRIWAGIAFVWGCMFWTIAKDPGRGRWMMKYAIIEKMITATAVTLAFYTPGSGVGARCFGFVVSTDHVWIPLFALVWVLTRKTARRGPGKAARADWVRESADRFGANWLRLAGLVSLGFAIWIFTSENFRMWLGSRPPALPFLAQIWAGMTALLGIVLLEVAAGDPCRRRAMLRYCIAARGLVAFSVGVALFSGEVAWPLAIVVLLADTVWIVPLFVIDAYWRGAPSVEWAYRDARRVLSERTN